MVSSDFYIPPLLKTLAGVVFKRQQCRQLMERLESASTKNFLGWGGGVITSRGRVT